jgi:DNA-binding transcriptional LysR family regulator
MEIRQLKYFISAATHMSFTKAAQENFVVQSAITHQISALEAELDVKLFERGNRLFKLTPAGELLLQEARNILAKSQEAVAKVKHAAGGYQHILRIGYFGRIMRNDLPVILQTYRRNYGDTKVALLQEPLVRLLDMLEAGTLDCFFSLQYDFFDDLPWIEKTVLFSDCVMLIMPKSHPLADRAELKPGEIEGENIIFLQEKGAAKKLQGHEKQGYTFHLTEEVTTSDSADILLTAGYGVALCTGHTRDPYNPHVAYVKLSMEGNERIPVIIARKKDSCSPALQHFLKILEEYDFSSYGA